MPTYLQGDKRNVLTFVKVLDNLYYGWNAKDLASNPGVGAGDLTALGHITAAAMAAIASPIAVIGANRPKPGRATKTINVNPDAATQGKVSTYIGKGSENTALAAGWKLTGYLEVVNLRNSARTTTVGVQLTGGGIYCFPINTVAATNYAALLGLQIPSALTAVERSKMFSGATRPRPPRVSLKAANGSTFSSFCDPTKLDDLLDAGWSQTDPEILFPLGTI